MELIYYVDTHDRPTGETEEKYAAHHANTKLHAAFSCYVFNSQGGLLVTRRADGKKYGQAYGQTASAVTLCQAKQEKMPLPVEGFMNWVYGCVILQK